MAPTSSTEPAPAVKQITLHQFLKQKQQLQRCLKPAVTRSRETAAAATGHPAHEDAGNDAVLGGAWLPRSYTCAFCRCEFKFATALGRHMNVHRRDRAKIRGHHGAAGQKLVAAAPAAGEAPHAAAPAEYAVLYPMPNFNATGAVLISSADVLLSTSYEDAADDDVLSGAWPPRSYTCAFCHCEFKSAQALGGHMNVHRRDRAKIRGHHDRAGQKLVAAAPAAGEAPNAAAPAEYAVLYPIPKSNAPSAVLIPSGDVLLSTPLALAPAHKQCHVSDDEDDKEVDLELRLWWP